MKIESGLFDQMVLQRHGRRGSRAAIVGIAEHNGALKVRVTQKTKLVRGFNWTTVGRAKAGKLTGAIAGIPAGGPYRIELRIDDRNGATLDRLTVRNVLVGDVWIAAGQSNMQGCGLRPGAAKPHPQVRAFYCHDEWKVARDPIHNLWDAVDQVHFDLGVQKGVVNIHAGVGPAVAFAKAMRKRTGAPQGILACAHGGTSMEQWGPRLKSPSGSTLYGAMLRRVRKNGGQVAGVIWYQGESDAGPDATPYYTKRMKQLVRASRRDLNAPALPWAVVQIGRVVGGSFPAESWNDIQDQQRRLPEKIDHLAVVPAIDLALDDNIHIGAEDQQRLGRRLAYAMDALLRGNRVGKPPIALRSIQTSLGHPAHGWQRITLTFDHAVGQLHAGGSRPTGFSVCDSEIGPFVYDVKTDGSRVHVSVNLPTASLDGRCVAYGQGNDPVCNIVDEADRSLPVIAPQRIGQARAVTPFASKVRVAMPVDLPSGVDAKLNGLKLPNPAAIRSLPWKTFTFADRYCDVHEKMQTYGARDYIVYFACEIDVPEPMKLIACLGYDGPVKMWIDGKEMIHDPEGMNPACEDRAKARFKATRGVHRVLIALGSNVGKAWGVFLRFERADVSPSKRKSGDVVLPTFRK